MRFYSKVFAFLVIAAACVLSLKAQENFTARNSIYVDAATRGAYYSVNYERIFSQGEKFSKTWQAGFSLLNDVIAFPLGIHFFTGHQRDHFEFGLTIVPYIEKYEKLFSPGNISDKKIYLFPGAGYRYQKPNGGFFFKAIIAPVIYLDPPSDHFWKMGGKLYTGGNLSAGISF
ncbi:MAG: hypothetical protein JST17_03995 [Bacteroidetes bacterium]|nr:hypothetical protein [Bacteroidota bacterium]MBS1929570.1 hypothetical protein [Bacteroidota bacterium]